MSHFWIQLAKNGMPVGVIKQEFYPSQLGFGWEDFGKRFELLETKTACSHLKTDLMRKNEEIEQLKKEIERLKSVNETLNSVIQDVY